MSTMTENENLLSAHACEEIDELLQRFPAEQKKSALLGALNIVQHENQGFLTKELMQAVADGDMATASMPCMSVREMAVCGEPARVARLSFTGELGYEIYLPAGQAGAAYDELVQAGAAFDIRPFGLRALVSMGMEKRFGVWSREFSPDYTPSMSGMDRFIDYAKPGFVGREAALADRNAEPPHRLVALEIDAADADAWGYEPVWHGDEYVGFTTSGAYGHTVGKSLAMGYLSSSFLDSAGGGLEVHLVDGRRPARILTEAPYDPAGARMRG